MEQANGARLLFSLIRMRRQLAPVLDAGFGGLSRAEYLVLRGVARGRFGGRGEPVRAAKLSEMLEVSRPAVTRVLNGLESRGLITRSIDRDDRRSINVELTEAGRKALGSADEEILSMAEKLAARLGDADTEKLIELLGRLADVCKDLSAGSEGGRDEEEAR
jgi:DNA-binding MarR family transcriptional regulator